MIVVCIFGCLVPVIALFFCANGCVIEFIICYSLVFVNIIYYVV